MSECPTCEGSGRIDFGEFGASVGPEPRRYDAPGSEPCEQCHGAGEIFTHADDCRDDICALNGDEHSCTGQVLKCGCAA